MERAYSGFGASKICQLLTYLDTDILIAPCTVLCNYIYNTLVQITK